MIFVTAAAAGPGSRASIAAGIDIVTGAVSVLISRVTVSTAFAFGPSSSPTSPRYIRGALTVSSRRVIVESIVATSTDQYLEQI
jgi:hypothetical protein